MARACVMSSTRVRSRNWTPEERLGPADLLGGELDDGLIHEPKLAPVECLGEIGSQRNELGCRSAHLGIEDAVSSLARVLGLIHRDVGVTEQALGRRVGMGDGDPDAGLNAEVVVVDRQREPEDLQDPFGDGDALGQRSVAIDENGELIPTQTERWCHLVSCRS